MADSKDETSWTAAGRAQLEVPPGLLEQLVLTNGTQNHIEMPIPTRTTVIKDRQQQKLARK